MQAAHLGEAAVLGLVWQASVLVPGARERSYFGARVSHTIPSNLGP